MKTIIITYTDGEVVTEGPYKESVAKQYSDVYKRNKLTKRFGIKSVRVVGA